MTSINVSDFHEAYQRETGMALALTITRIDRWTLFSQRFTVQDLTMLLRYLRREIESGSRRPGCLKLTNLLLDLDVLEEDIQLAKARTKPIKTARDTTLNQLRPTFTQTANMGQLAKPVSALTEKALEQLRAEKERLFGTRA